MSGQIFGINNVVYPLNEDFSVNENYYKLLIDVQDAFLIESTQDKEIIHKINLLRKILKYKPDFFPTVFDNIYDTFKKLMFSENNDVVLITFVFLSELLSQDLAAPEMKDWILYFTPLILEMSTKQVNSEELKSLTMSCLDTLVSKDFYEETFLVLIDGMGDSEELYSLNSSTALYTFLTKCGNKDYLVSTFEWNKILSDVLGIYAKKERKEVADGFMNTLRNEVFNEEQYERLLVTLDAPLLYLINEIWKFDIKKIKFLQQEAKKLNELHLGLANSEY